MDALAITVDGRIHAVVPAAEGRLLSIDVVRVVHGETDDLPARDDVRLGAWSFGAEGEAGWSWPDRALAVGDEVRVKPTTAEPTPATVHEPEPSEEEPPDAVALLREAASYLPATSDDPRVDALRERLQALVDRAAPRGTP